MWWVYKYDEDVPACLIEDGYMDDMSTLAMYIENSEEQGELFSLPPWLEPANVDNARAVAIQIWTTF